MSKSNDNQNQPTSPTSTSSSSAAYSDDVLQLAEKIESSFRQLAAILEEAVELDHYLRTHEVIKNSKQFNYIDEMLTRCLLRIDEVQTHGVQEVRQYRREVVVKVNGIAAVLDLIREAP
jgi:hypothetical protein